MSDQGYDPLDWGTATSERTTSGPPAYQNIYSQLRSWASDPQLPEDLRRGLMQTLYLYDNGQITPEQLFATHAQTAVQLNKVGDPYQANVTEAVQQMFDALPFDMQGAIAAKYGDRIVTGEDIPEGDAYTPAAAARATVLSPETLRDPEVQQEIYDSYGRYIQQEQRAEAAAVPFRDRNPIGFYDARSRLMDLTGIDATRAGAIIDKVAADKSYTTAIELFEEPEAVNRAIRSMVSNDLPTYFYDENGQFYINYVGYGYQPAETIAPLTRFAPAAAIEEVEAEDPIEAAFLRRQAGISIEAPVVPVSRLDQLGEDIRKYRYSTYGGGGGGGGLTFDRPAIEEGIRAAWQATLLEQPSNLGALVNKYMSDAQVAGRGLNVEAWTLQQMRNTARYRIMYKQKPEDMSERDYIGRYTAVTDALSLRDKTRLRENIAGAAAGVSQQAFAQRLQQSREAQMYNLGGFSTRLAETARSLGSLMYS